MLHHNHLITEIMKKNGYGDKYNIIHFRYVLLSSGCGPDIE